MGVAGKVVYQKNYYREYGVILLNAHNELALYKSGVTKPKFEPTNSVLRQEQDLSLSQYRRTILWTRGHKLAQQILLQTRASNDMVFVLITL